MKFSTIAALPLIASEVDARFKWGMCPSGLRFAKLDQEEFEGMWYEIMRDKYFPMEIGATCATQNYKNNANGTMEYFYRAKWLWWYNGVGGYLSNCKFGTPSTFTCKSTMHQQPNKAFNWEMIHTDNDKYAIMYNCFNRMDNWFHDDYITVLSKDQTMSDETIAKVKSIVASQLPDYDMGDHNMVHTKQGSRCEYAPDHFE